MTQETAVEWFVNELNLNEIIEKNNLIFILDIIKKAKEMEREQIIKARKGCGCITCNYHSESGIKYYNQTYNK